MSSGRSDFQAYTSVSHETLVRFDLYAEQLRLWNPKINLVSATTLPDLWMRHFLDSAQLRVLIPEGTQTIADLGSGAGFPGLVLALLMGIKVHLLESDQRKCIFLREVSRVTRLDTEIHASRIESVPSLGVDVVTARALAPLERLIPMALHHLKPNGTCVFLKGADSANEIFAARQVYDFTCEQFPSRTSADGAIVRLTNIRERATS